MIHGHTVRFCLSRSRVLIPFARLETHSSPFAHRNSLFRSLITTIFIVDRLIVSLARDVRFLQTADVQETQPIERGEDA